MLCNLHPCCSRMVNNNDESEGIKFSMSYLVQTTKEVAKAFISAASAATVRCHLWSIVWRREWQPNAEWLVEKRVPSDSMIYICIEVSFSCCLMMVSSSKVDMSSCLFLMVIQSCC